MKKDLYIEIDKIFNTKLDMECYANFKEVYFDLLYNKLGVLQTKLLHNIKFNSTALYNDMQKRLSFDPDLEHIKSSCKLALIQNNITDIPRCHCGNIIKYSYSRHGLYSCGCSSVCQATLVTVKLKRKQTNLERWGVEYPAQSIDVREKMKQTNLDRLGVEHALQNIIIQEKIKQTNLDRRGVENPTQCKKVREKSKQTNLKRYGFDNPSQCKEIREKMRTTYLQNHLDSIWDNILSNTHCRPLFSKEDYIGSSYDISYSWECTNCNHHYDSHYYSGIVKACPLCNRSRSKGEIELYNYIQSLIPDIEVIANDYTVIHPKELDIYIPSLNLAFEYNGDYWHGLKEDGYHEGKTNGCLDKGIILYHILESDWKSNNEDVKDLIKSVLCRL